MKTLLKILSILLFIPSMTYAQLEYHNWIFGNNLSYIPGENLTGITFMTESGEPEYYNHRIPFGFDTTTYFQTSEGSTCLSSASGKLQYHTVNKGLISLKEDIVIIDDTNLDGNSSGTQYVCLVRVGDIVIRIATSSYVDYVGPNPDLAKQDLTYTLLYESEGKLEISEKKVIKEGYGSEAIAVLKDFESNSFYLIANDRIKQLYYLYKYEIDTDSFILKSRISSFMKPDKQTNGRPKLAGYIKVSPNGNLIVSNLAGNSIGIEILKFNRETESLELIKTFNDNDNIEYSLSKYSGEFSPNSEHFYMKGYKYYYAITNFSEIDSLKIKKVSDELPGGEHAFQLGPNGKIYIVNNSENYLSSIENPNNINDFQFIEKSVDLRASRGRAGLPNIPTSYYFQVSTDIDSLDICIGDEIYIETETLNEPADAEYIWTDPIGMKYETKNLEIDSATEDMTGIFELSIKSIGYNLKRQVYVNVKGPKFEIETYRTSICVGDTNTIYIKNPYIAKVSESILWSTGDTTRGTLINAPGVYSVTVVDFDGCSVTESITINDAKPEIEINPLLPTIFCMGDSTILEVTPFDNSNTYTWSNGELGKQITVKTGGTYSVSVLEGENCRETAYIEVKVNENLEPTITGSNICSGESATLEVLPNDPSYTYKWSNGEETPVIVVNQAGTYSVTVSKAGCVGTAERTVNESPTPEFDILGESIICSNETATLASSEDFAEYFWSTNEITKEIEVTEAGTYTLTVTDENGCTATESFTVDKYELSFDISKDRINFGKVYITETKKESIEIVNNSGVDVMFEAGTNFIKVFDGRTYKIDYPFIPTQLGAYNDNITLKVTEPCDTVITIPITATVFARTTISTEDIYTQIGQTETVPVYLECEAELPSQEYSITTDIDRTAFFTTDSYVINQTQPISQTRTEIHELTGTILLSDDLEYGITFPNYTFTNPYIEVIEQPGKIYIDSVCVFPLRNITTFDPTSLSINPNPASEQLNIDITTGVQGTMKLELVATDGRVIYIDEWTQSTKSKQMQINTINIPSGLYQVRLITPYDAITKSVVVVE